MDRLALSALPQTAFQKALLPQTFLQQQQVAVNPYLYNNLGNKL